MSSHNALLNQLGHTAAIMLRERHALYPQMAQTLHYGETLTISNQARANLAHKRIVGDNNVLENINNSIITGNNNTVHGRNNIVVGDDNAVAGSGNRVRGRRSTISDSTSNHYVDADVNDSSQSSSAGASTTLTLAPLPLHTSAAYGGGIGTAITMRSSGSPPPDDNDAEAPAVAAKPARKPRGRRAAASAAPSSAEPAPKARKRSAQQPAKSQARRVKRDEAVACLNCGEPASYLAVPCGCAAACRECANAMNRRARNTNNARLVCTQCGHDVQRVVKPDDI
jgi:hypothetical protein